MISIWILFFFIPERTLECFIALYNKRFDIYCPLYYVRLDHPGLMRIRTVPSRGFATHRARPPLGTAPPWGHLKVMPFHA
jgi:hypothetical protein